MFSFFIFPLGANSRTSQSLNGVPYTGVRNTMTRILKEEGVAKLFSGIQPRVMWISLGGFIFFGCYEKTKKVLQGLP